MKMIINNLKRENMTKCILLIKGLLLFQTVSAQDGIGIGTSFVDSCAILEIDSDRKGVLLPRLSNSQVTTLESGDFSLTAGLVLYNISENVFFFWDGDSWEELTTKAYVDSGNSALQSDISTLQAVAPLSGQKAALVGTSGTPSSTNEYVTNSDSRMTNSRTPTGSAGGGLQGTYPTPALAYPRIEKVGIITVGDIALDKSGTVTHNIGSTSYQVFFGGISNGTAVHDNDIRFPVVTSKMSNSFSWSIAEGATTTQDVQLTYMIIRTGL